MAKKVKPTNISAKKIKGNGMGHKRGKHVEDWISRLPDEILVSILSLLTLKEAARTSVLSTRWKDMWTYITSLNFDGSNILDEIQLENMVLERERPQYVCWVNQVLKSHQGPAIEEFRVRFDICGSPRHDIDNWVKFAIEKKVRRFELDLSQCWGVSQNKCYTFPYLFCIDNHLLSQPLGFARCNSLINLRLMSVNVTGEVIEYFLTNCPLLEQLAVNGSNSLLSLIVGSASLKHLEVSDCDNVKNIEISAKNLMSFMYIGPKINVPFKDVPMLVQLCIGGEYCEPLNRLFELSSSLSQLKSLKLVINHVEGRIDFAELPVFCKLKQLELEVSAYDDKNLLIFTPLIHASPLLSKFTLQLCWAHHGRRRKPRRSRTCPHHCLKEVEFVGFVGQTLDVELAMYLIKNAVLLEKITFDTRIPALLGSPFEFEETKERRAARKRAELFRAKLPPTIALKCSQCLNGVNENEDITVDGYCQQLQQLLSHALPAVL